MSRRKSPHRHPAKPSRDERRAKRYAAFKQPDATEQRLQQLNRRMRQAISAAPEGDGLITGPLTVAAEYAAERLCEVHDLDADEHVAAITHWLVPHMAEPVRDFDLDAYKAWR